MEVLYTKEHEWIRIEGTIGTVGITGYAVDQLGDITFVELPKTGKEVRQFEALCGIESVKAASDIYAPLGGRVIEVNDALDEHPEIINEDAEDDGWIARIEITDPKGMEKLMSRRDYEEYVRGLE
ncbi:MAG TPA: glycine cleavage system protein GcvH [Geobacteraceae bacterium]|nr:glycine cleavage system protein GcvH [Geobacteraceae bacterium]